MAESPQNHHSRARRLARAFACLLSTALLLTWSCIWGWEVFHYGLAEGSALDDHFDIAQKVTDVVFDRAKFTIRYQVLAPFQVGPPRGTPAYRQWCDQLRRSDWHVGHIGIYGDSPFLIARWAMIGYIYPPDSAGVRRESPRGYMGVEYDFFIAQWILGPLLLLQWLALCGPPIVRRRRQRARRKRGVCANCGYNLTGNTTGRCPECGTTPQ